MKSAFSFVVLTTVFVLGIISFGYIVSLTLVARVDRSQQAALLTQTKQAALLISPQDIASLAGTQADLTNPTYERLKAQFTKFRDANPDIRLAYAMTYNEGRHAQLYYVDSEAPSSPLYSPPGEYYKISDEEIQQYRSGEVRTDGPYTDAGIEWISGYAPIKDGAGTVVAVVGVDMMTAPWHRQLVLENLMLAAIVALLSVIIVIISGNVYRRMNAGDAASKRDQRPQTLKGPLKHMQQLAHVGTFVIQFPEELVEIDEQFQPLFGNVRLEKDAFRTYIHLEDQEKYEDMLNEIKSSNIVYSWVDIRIGTTEAGFRKYHIYGNIERHASGPAEKFDGVIQDITDAKPALKPENKPEIKK